jgi:hypothetical protein
LEAIELTQQEIDASQLISGACRSPELAEMILKAVLTGKRLAKLKAIERK